MAPFQQPRRSSSRTLTIAVGTVIGLLALITAIATPAGSAPRTRSPQTAAVTTFSMIGTHPGAAAQPTDQGRAILDLTVHGGRVYAGYGDYAANTGPIAVTGFDIAAKAFVPEYTADTEALYNLRVVNDRLVAPATDPRVSADYFTSEPWSAATSLRATHVFDTATLTGADLWMVGSKDYDAVAWRSLDGGQTWVEALRVSPKDADDPARFYFAAVSQGRLFVQATDMQNGPHRNSMVFDGQSWASGPSLLGRGQWGWAPQSFGDRVVYQGLGQGYLSDIRIFDGKRASTISSGYDTAVAAGTLYVLGADGLVKATTDLRSWSTVGYAPPTSRSLAIDGTTVYVGTTSSEIWSMSLN